MENPKYSRTNFYVMKRPWAPFPVLEQMMCQENMCPLQIVYLIESAGIPQILTTISEKPFQSPKRFRKRSNTSSGNLFVNQIIIWE